MSGHIYSVSPPTLHEHERVAALTYLPQIQDPSNNYEHDSKTVSSGDYSFEAKRDGKYTYCFSNEHWSANSKEVSFNVHGIVYVPELEAPADPLEKESEYIHKPCLVPAGPICNATQY
jgi:hypothetical protein